MCNRSARDTGKQEEGGFYSRLTGWLLRLETLDLREREREEETRLNNRIEEKSFHFPALFTRIYSEFLV